MSEINELIARINRLQVGESLIIGNGAVDVRLSGVGISAKHTKIERKEMGLFIRDLASSSGTFVNRVKIQGAQRLKSGDVIKIGKNEWTFSAADFVPKPAEKTVVRKRSWFGFFRRLVFGKK